jgi:RNA polymerase sigma-70 factor, ECF subfamily
MNQRILSNNEAVIGGSLRGMSDESLVAAAQGGNINAFAELRHRHFRTLLRRTYRITRNWEDAEDALQDSFLKAFTRLNSFEGRSTFSSWVTRIAINQSLMVLRKRRTINDQSIGAGDDCCGSNDRWEMRDVREDPEHLYVRHERSELLRGAIRRMRPCLRDVLELQYAQEYSIQEIADALGISSAAAKSRLFHARVSLRTLLRKSNLRSCNSERTR